MLTDSDARSWVGEVAPTQGRAPVGAKAAADLMVSILTGDGDGVSWRKGAACQAASADLFFPVGSTGPAEDLIEAAKSVCQSCPVRVACLRFALETNQEFGVWGGTSEDERKRLRRVWLTHRPSLRRRATA